MVGGFVHYLDLQVEVNIGQVGGPGCATAMRKLHKRMVEKAENLHYGKFPSLVNAKMPENKSRRGMAETMLAAWKLFGDEKAVLVNLDQVLSLGPFFASFLGFSEPARP